MIRSKDGFYAPVGKEPAKIIGKVLEEFPASRFERVPKKTAEKLSGFKITEQRDMFDYVYSVEDLRELKGNRFEPKRNLIKQFRQNDPEVCKLTEDSVQEFFELQKRWCRLRSCGDDKQLLHENDAITEALHNFKRFGLCGTCVRIDDEVVGFAVGEKLNENTYVEHFEKGDTAYTGIYQFVLSEFAKKIDAEFLNREQDLGIEGIRRAKKSYNPAGMVEKFMVHKP